MCIDLETGDWSINSVYTDEGTLYGDIYDLEGHLLSGDKPLCSEGLVRMVSRHPMVDFVLERNRTDELLLTVKENPGGVAFPLFIVVGNQYEARTINLSLEPSEPYRLDSISYVLYSYGVRDSLSFANGDETVVVCNSHSSQFLQSLIYPFRNASAWAVYCFRPNRWIYWVPIGLWCIFRFRRTSGLYCRMERMLFRVNIFRLQYPNN